MSNYPPSSLAPIVDKPLVSVICPTRNGAEHLASAIESVLNQDYEHIELIVIDGASDDHSVEILASFGERILVVSEPDSGQSDAINKGMSLARGDILAWLNSDDEYVPGAVRAAVEAFRSTGSDAIYGDALAVDGHGRRYGHRMNVTPGSASRLLQRKFFVVQPASFWRREVWDLAGPLREDLHYSLDYDFFMRVVKDFELSYWPYTFAVERLHSGAKTFRGHRERIDEIRSAAIENGATDLPSGFQAEGAAVYVAEALDAFRAGDKEKASKLTQQAREWNPPKLRFAIFFVAVSTFEGRGMPRLRLLANYVVSRRRALSHLGHENPKMVRHSLRRSSSRNGFRRKESLKSRAFRSAQKLRMSRLLHSAGPRLGVLTQHTPKPLNQQPPQARRAGVKLPSLTVVTPSFNQGLYLRSTVESVLGQNYPNLEYFVQDGGSSDESRDILESIDHPSMSWVSAPDSGQANAINAGHQKGTGEIMAWLNSDDIFLPGVLHYVGAFFAENPSVDVVYSHRVLIDNHGDEIGRWLLPAHDSEALTWADYVPQETMFWRRSIWDQVGGIDESFRFAMDWDLLLRFEERGANIVRLPIFGGGFRVYDEQLTSSVIESLGADEMTRLRRRCHGRDVSSSEIAQALTPYLVRHVALDKAWQAGLLHY